MALWGPILIAVSLHFLLGTSVYAIQEHEKCEKAPSVASWIAVAAMILLLRDANLYPLRYTHLPLLCQVIIETLACIACMELLVAKGWCFVERLLLHSSRLALLKMGVSERKYLAHEYLILGILTTAFACFVFVMAAMATNLHNFDFRSLLAVNRRVKLNMKEFRNYVEAKRRPVDPNLRPILKHGARRK